MILVLIGLATGIINARWLGAKGVGILTLALLMRILAFRFGNLGFGSAFAFFVARKRATGRSIVSLAIWTGLASSLVSLAIFGLCWELPHSPWNDIEPRIVHLALVIIPIFFVRTQLQRVLSGELRIREMNASELIMHLAYLAFLVIMLIVLDLGLIGAVLAMLIGEALSLAFLFWRALLLRTAMPGGGEASEPLESVGAASGGRPTLGELWRYGRWNYLLMLSNFLVEELPLLLLKTISGDATAVGLMSRAQRLSREPRNVAFTIAQVLFPFTAASEDAAATQRTNVLCRNSLLLVGIFILGLAPFIRPILLLLYGEEFVPAAEIFYALALSAVIWPMGHFLAIHIAASGAPRQAFLASFTAALCAGLLCLLVIPVYGAVGAGLCATVVYVIRTAVLVVTYRRLTGASLSQVLFVQRTDLGYYRRLLNVLPLNRLRGASAD
jgi:O-antigen/teichoic acid export membrane protein